jgi:hypothetical protein
MLRLTDTVSTVNTVEWLRETWLVKGITMVIRTLN